MTDTRIMTREREEQAIFESQKRMWSSYYKALDDMLESELEYVERYLDQLEEVEF